MNQIAYKAGNKTPRGRGDFYKRHDLPRLQACPINPLESLSLCGAQIHTDHELRVFFELPHHLTVHGRTIFSARMGLKIAMARTNLLCLFAGHPARNSRNVCLDCCRRQDEVSIWSTRLDKLNADKIVYCAAAKLAGAVVGVSIGCVIGMLPLLFMDSHEHDDPSVHGPDAHNSQ